MTPIIFARPANTPVQYPTNLSGLAPENRGPHRSPSACWGSGMVFDLVGLAPGAVFLGLWRNGV